jgi:hypothetical protein
MVFAGKQNTIHQGKIHTVKHSIKVLCAKKAKYQDTMTESEENKSFESTSD